MRALLLSCALLTTLATPLLAEAPAARFIKVDIVSKSGFQHHMKEGGPTEVHLRMPITLARGILDMAASGDIKVNGKTRKEMKVDQLVKLVESARPGDLLLELTTDKGDLVKIVVE